jgi:toxin ParE1/3/4
VSHIFKREAAKRDLIAQWVWYAENASIEVADKFLVATEKALASLSVHPESGTPVFVRNAELQGLRRMPVSGGFEKILLFYVPLKDGVDLIRVVHGRRDLEKLFHSES